MNKLLQGDCLQIMPTLAENSIDTIITDPPYGLTFMGKEWDRGVPGEPFWREALRVAKPGAFLLAFGGTRTYHRLACAIEDAGWEIRDCLMWLYGSGFPKSMDISKAIDKAAGAKREVIRTTSSGGYKRLMTANVEQGFRPADYYEDGNKFTSKEAVTDLAKQWNGWGTALKPAWEPIILAMKPLDGTYVANATKHGVAGLNIDGGRIPLNGERPPSGSGDMRGRNTFAQDEWTQTHMANGGNKTPEGGRWPANVILDEEAGVILDAQSGTLTSGKPTGKRKGTSGQSGIYSSDSNRGGASRFFYCAKASKKEKGADNTHPTVKPLALMEYLCRLTATPTGGIVLDPFMGSGTTGVAAKNTGRDFIGIEMDATYFGIAKKRVA
jgi:DNA modification methylase